MDLRRVRDFVVTAELMSFTRAAQELRMAQPSLSSRIRALEEELGVRLFSRARRQVELTRAGREFLGHARHLLAAADEAVAATRRAARSTAPERLVITTLADGVDELKAAVLLAVRRRAPDLAVTLTGASFVDHVSALRQGRADAAYVWPPYSAASIAGLYVEPLRDFPRLLAVASDHPMAAAGRVGLDDLARVPQVPLPAEVDPIFVAGWRLVPAPPIAEAAPVRDVRALLEAVARGIGCAPVPALLARNATTPGVAFVPLIGVGAATLALAWRRGEAGARHTLLRQAAQEALPAAAR